MIVSEKFTSYYESLNGDDKLKALKVVCELCDEHAELMDKKQIKLQNLLLQSNILTARALKAATISELNEIQISMDKIKKSIEEESKYLTVERYIEIHFGL